MDVGYGAEVNHHHLIMEFSLMEVNILRYMNVLDAVVSGY